MSNTYFPSWSTIFAMLRMSMGRTQSSTKKYVCSRDGRRIALAQNSDPRAGKELYFTLRLLNEFNYCRPFFHSMKRMGSDWILASSDTTSSDITSSISIVMGICHNNHFSVVEALVGRKDMANRVCRICTTRVCAIGSVFVRVFTDICECACKSVRKLSS